MHLWTEYEGRTIAGAYTLEKLLRSEGRNGFFATSDTAGHSAVIRLTEAHFDEDEQLKRWRQVAGVHQSNLIEIEKVGQTTFEGIALTYALMEPDDANLGDVLKERPLTTTETLQVAKSVLAALSALHKSGLVHEHIEPANVLAVGETVKLRSDCVRECLADGEFISAEDCADLRRGDIHAYGVLLLQCLTLEKEWTSATRVAEPFQRLLPHILEGDWSLEQIAAFLDPAAALPVPVPAVAPAVLHGTAPVTASPAPAAAAASTARPLVPPGVRQATSVPPFATTPAVSVSPRPEPSISVRAQDRFTEPEPTRFSMNMIWTVCIASALLIAFLAYHFLSGKPGKAAGSASAPVAEVAPAVSPDLPAVVAPSPAVAPPASAPASSGAEPTPAHARAAHNGGWYVIAYTYNFEDQARAKAHRIAEQHDGFHPEVFSPHGHAPFFVSLGGAMSEAEAQATVRRARHAGLARDTFMRRY